MMKPSIPQGTRDFGSDVVRKRRYIFDTIRSVFEVCGFQPLETPAMENLETLMGKYGDEGDKLIFKILNNGLDNPTKHDRAQEGLKKVLAGKSSDLLTERALRYDLTIPFARYVAMNHAQLSFPFKRYQMQPVWRADRPQRGRYREFYQCDADIVGSNALINEVDFVHIYHAVFQRLGIPGYELRINSRKILAALAEITGGKEKLTAITIAIDKLDKIGLDKVKLELEERGILPHHIGIIETYLQIDGSNEVKLAQIHQLMQASEIGKKGIEEITYVLDQSASPSSPPNVSIDFTLARGLDYYTGIIFEAKAPQQIKMGSIGGGGRYDDLTGFFGVPNIPGVGISFGVDRIFDVMEELQLFPETIEGGTQVLFFNMGEQESKAAYGYVHALRRAGIATELFHESVKKEKQFKYAEKKGIPVVAIIDGEHMTNRSCSVKNIRTGVERTLPFDLLVSTLTKDLATSPLSSGLKN